MALSKKADKERKKLKRASMSKVEKDKERARDRLRKKKKSEELSDDAKKRLNEKRNYSDQMKYQSDESRKNKKQSYMKDYFEILKNREKNLARVKKALEIPENRISCKLDG